MKNTKVYNNGNGNQILIGNHAELTNCEFRFSGDHNNVIIGGKAKIKGVVFWIEDNHNLIKIGESSTFEGNTQLAACEGTQIEIGNDCMFSHSILVRSTDSHSIINVEGERINSAANIRIGHHVWVGLQSLILKGANIPDNCVVGARSVVSSSKDIEQNSVIVGSPAKCVRKNIDWQRDRI